MEVFVWHVMKVLGIVVAVALGIFAVALIGSGYAAMMNWAFS